jgi:hypothetical protein
MAVFNYQTATQRLHKTVFYYENNEYLIKCILPEGAAAPAGSLAVLRHEISAVKPLHSNSFFFFWFASPRFEPQTNGVLSYSYVGAEGDHSVIYLVYAGLGWL